jgi:hypothetical protein
MGNLQTRKPSNAIALRKAADFANGVRTFGGFPEQSFEFGKRGLDGVEVGRVRRKIEQARARPLD